MTSFPPQTRKGRPTLRAVRTLVELGLVAAATAASATNAAEHQHRFGCSNARTITINPPALLDPTPFGYKHITLDTRNAVAYVAGQVAFSLGGQIVGTTLNEQLVLTEQNLRANLDALDADVQDILRMNVFVKNFQQSRDLPVLEPFLFRMGSPVDAVLGVTSLAIDALVVEVQMTVAVRPSTVERIRCSRRR
jgi:enamine deaminase RidA (YjgF/YER057c/UK114 family)